MKTPIVNEVYSWGQELPDWEDKPHDVALVAAAIVKAEERLRKIAAGHAYGPCDSQSTPLCCDWQAEYAKEYFRLDREGEK